MGDYPRNGKTCIEVDGHLKNQDPSDYHFLSKLFAKKCLFLI